MSKRDTARRPSQADQEFVKTRDGRRVRNECYDQKLKKSRLRQSTGTPAGGDIMGSLAGAKRNDPSERNNPEYLVAAAENAKPTTSEMRQVCHAVALSAAATAGNDVSNGFSYSKVTDGMASLKNGDMNILIDANTPTDDSTINIHAIGKDNIPLTVKGHVNTISNDLRKVTESLQESGSAIGDVGFTAADVDSHNFTFTRNGMDVGGKTKPIAVQGEFGDAVFTSHIGDRGAMEGIHVGFPNDDSRYAGRISYSSDFDSGNGHFDVSTTSYSDADLDAVEEIADKMKKNVGIAREMNEFFADKKIDW